MLCFFFLFKSTQNAYLQKKKVVSKCDLTSNVLNTYIKRVIEISRKHKQIINKLKHKTKKEQKLYSFILINKYLCDKHTTELLTFFMQIHNYGI